MNDNLEIKSNKKLDEKDASDIFMARQIVQEIMNFGVNQHQLTKIIQILALELEDRDLMLKIDGLIEENLGEGDTSHNKQAKDSLIKDF